MLTLTRKTEESIELVYAGKRLGALTVISASGGKASLAFDCDGELRILRSEIAEAVLAAPHDEEPAAA